MDSLDFNLIQDPLALVQLARNQLPHYLCLKQMRTLERAHAAGSTATAVRLWSCDRFNAAFHQREFHWTTSQMFELQKTRLAFSMESYTDPLTFSLS